MSGKIMLETPRLLLREVAESDVDGFFEMDSDPEVVRYVGAQPVPSRAKSLEVIRFVQKQYADFGIGRWAVVVKETGAFAGWCGLKYMHGELLNGRTDFIDIGYRFGRTHWGKGYATESARAVLQYGFEALDYPEIFGCADILNHASIHVLTKIGMTEKNNFEWYGREHTWFEARNPLETRF